MRLVVILNRSYPGLRTTKLPQTLARHDDRLRARIDEDEAAAQLRADGAERPRAGEGVEAPVAPP